MEDSEIIELYFVRSELAIWKTDKKYGDYLHRLPIIFCAVYAILKSALSRLMCCPEETKASRKNNCKIWRIKWILAHCRM